MPERMTNPESAGWYWVWAEPGDDPEPAEWCPDGRPGQSCWYIAARDAYRNSVWAWSGPIPGPPACPR